MQNLIVVIVLVCCALWLGRRLWRQFRAAGTNGPAPSCGCGCSGCDSKTTDGSSSCAPTTDKGEES